MGILHTGGDRIYAVTAVASCSYSEGGASWDLAQDSRCKSCQPLDPAVRGLLLGKSAGSSLNLHAPLLVPRLPPFVSGSDTCRLPCSTPPLVCQRERLTAQRMLWNTFTESLRLLTSCMSPVEACQHNTALAQVLDEEEHPLVQGGGQNGHTENGLQQHAASLEQTAYGASCRPSRPGLIWSQGR